MRQGKTVARIFLISTIVNVVLAAPATVRQRHSVADGSDEESSGVSFLTVPPPASELSHQDSVPRSPLGSFYQDWAPVSVALQSRGDLPSEPEIQPVLQPPPLDPPAASGPAQLPNDPPPASRPGHLPEQFHDDKLPWWDWHFHWPFKRSPERDHSLRYFWRLLGIFPSCDVIGRGAGTRSSGPPTPKKTGVVWPRSVEGRGFAIAKRSNTQDA